MKCRDGRAVGWPGRAEWVEGVSATNPICSRPNGSRRSEDMDGTRTWPMLYRVVHQPSKRLLMSQSVIKRHSRRQMQLRPNVNPKDIQQITPKSGRIDSSAYGPCKTTILVPERWKKNGLSIIRHMNWALAGSKAVNG